MDSMSIAKWVTMREKFANMRNNVEGHSTHCKWHYLQAIYDFLLVTCSNHSFQYIAFCFS